MLHPLRAAKHVSHRKVATIELATATICLVKVVFDLQRSRGIRMHCSHHGMSVVQGVGKSCLVLRYVRNQFDPSSKITVSSGNQQQQ
jgi:hypothetical protein